MKRVVIMGLMAAMVVAQSGVVSYASDSAAKTVVKFPFRVITGAAGVGVGTVAGGINGIVETEKEFSEKTFGRADDNPLWIPVGIVGSAVAVPVGFLMGAPKGMVEWGRKGYQVWDGM
ncbi:MAG: hypothetical protein AB7P76_07610 [Candidatus Melainabacteria bacterium]